MIFSADVPCCTFPHKPDSRIPASARQMSAIWIVTRNRGAKSIAHATEGATVHTGMSLSPATRWYSAQPTPSAKHKYWYVHPQPRRELSFYVRVNVMHRCVWYSRRQPTSNSKWPLLSRGMPSLGSLSRFSPSGNLLTSRLSDGLKFESRNLGNWTKIESALTFLFFNLI